jgi:hypothetical protein
MRVPLLGLTSKCETAMLNLEAIELGLDFRRTLFAEFPSGGGRLVGLA